MARKPRIQYPGAIHHILSRGNKHTSDDIVTPGRIIVMRDPELSVGGDPQGVRGTYFSQIAHRFDNLMEVELDRSFAE